MLVRSVQILYANDKYVKSKDKTPETKHKGVFQTLGIRHIHKKYSNVLIGST